MSMKYDCCTHRMVEHIQPVLILKDTAEHSLIETKEQECG
jgi:hypothetical protein